jgi:glycosyltransferase involved in cell wall biosynthesis
LKHIAMVVWNTFQHDARVLKEAQTLARAGYHVTVFALDEPGKTCQYQDLEPGLAVRRVNRFPLRRRSAPSAPRARSREAVQPPASPLLWGARIISRGLVHANLAYQLARARADAVHAHDVNTLATAWIAARLARARLVYDAHEISTSREGYQAIRPLIGWIEKQLMPRADATITTTDLRAKFFARAYHVPRPLVLQNRPRLAELRPTPRIREELRLGENWPIVLYQGGLQQGRGLERLVLAASEVAQAYFVFIGGGRLEGRLRELVEERSLGSRVRFIPTVPLQQLASYTASADIGIQPLENTCFNHFTTDSNKLFEYTMAGLPVIASDLPEIGRIVRKYDLGLLVKPGNQRSLIDALNLLVSDVSLRCHCAEQARAASAELNWETQEEELVALYERVFTGHVA